MKKNKKIIILGNYGGGIVLKMFMIAKDLLPPLRLGIIMEQGWQ